MSSRLKMLKFLNSGSLYAQKGLAAIEPIVRNFVMMPNSLELELLTGEKESLKPAALIGMGVKISLLNSRVRWRF